MLIIASNEDPAWEQTSVCHGEFVLTRHKAKAVNDHVYVPARMLVDVVGIFIVNTINRSRHTLSPRRSRNVGEKRP